MIQSSEDKRVSVQGLHSFVAFLLLLICDELDITADMVHGCICSGTTAA